MKALNFNLKKSEHLRGTIYDNGNVCEFIKESYFLTSNKIIVL